MKDHFGKVPPLWKKNNNAYYFPPVIHDVHSVHSMYLPVPIQIAYPDSVAGSFPIVLTGWSDRADCSGCDDGLLRSC